MLGFKGHLGSRVIMYVITECIGNHPFVPATGEQRTGFLTRNRPIGGSRMKTSVAIAAAPQPAPNAKTGQRQLMPFWSHRNAKLPASAWAMYAAQLKSAPARLRPKKAGTLELPENVAVADLI